MARGANPVKDAEFGEFWQTVGMQESQQQRARVSNVNEPDGAVDDPTSTREAEVKATKPREIGGPKGVEPTRFGDWERAGRCIDF